MQPINQQHKLCFTQVMRKCWAHCPEVRPSFRVLKEQLINVSQGLINDWLNLLRCLRLSSSPTGRTILPPKSPSLGRSPSIVPSLSSSYNSSTLPLRGKDKIREPASLPNSIDFLHLSSTMPVVTGKLKRDEASTPSPSKTGGHNASQPSSSGSSNVCEICSSYGHPWIEICNAIRATRGKWFVLINTWGHSHVIHHSSHLIVIIIFHR